MIVVDASVAAKWFLPEANWQAAFAVLERGVELAAPALIAVEVAGAITRSGRDGRMAMDEAHALGNDWLARLQEGAVALHADATLLADAFDLSLELLHPIQDCLYLALAQRLDAPLVTADRTFAAGAGDRARVEVIAGA